MTRPLRIPIAMQFAHDPGRRVALVGDFPEWQQPVPMTEVAPGQYRCQLELAPGLYRYRFLVDSRRFASDPAPVAVDRAEGHDNALLVVGGALPPLYFAPDRRHLARYADGRLVLHGEVDTGAPMPDQVWVETRCDEPTGVPPLQLAPIERGRVHGGRAQFRARLALPTELPGCCRFGFVGYPAHVFSVPESRSAAGAPPAWLDGATFYAIFVDRWQRAAGSIPDPRQRARSRPSNAHAFYGGDLDGISASLPEIRDLGVDAIVLTPLHVSPTPHRYDAVDLQTIDPLLGGEPALQRLIAAAHDHGLRLVLDLSVTHVNERHPAFLDLLAQQERSRFASWFAVRRFPVKPWDARSYAFFYDRPDLPLLNLGPGPAREHAIEAALKLVRLGVDGLRLDAMNDAPASFWAELRQRVRVVNPELLLLGEVVTDRAVRFAEERGVDVATDFAHREALVRLFGRSEIGPAQFAAEVEFAAHRFGPFDACFRLLFADNHDTARFLSIAGSRERLQLVLGYLLFRREPVWLTYGTELELSIGKDLVSRLDDAWPDRLPLPSGRLPTTPTRELLVQLLEQRRSLQRAGAGDTAIRSADGPLLELERPLASGCVRALFNCDPQQPLAVALPDGARTLLTVNDAATDPRAPLPALAGRWVQLP